MTRKGERNLKRKRSVCDDAIIWTGTAIVTGVLAVCYLYPWLMGIIIVVALFEIVGGK